MTGFFSGRLSRLPFALLSIGVTVSAVMFHHGVPEELLSGPGFGERELGGALFVGAVLVLSVLSIPRFHDLGMTGWWALGMFVPVVDPLILLLLLLWPGTKGDNAWGAQPGRVSTAARPDAPPPPPPGTGRPPGDGPLLPAG